MILPTRTARAFAFTSIAGLALTGCTSNSKDSKGEGKLTVSSTSSECKVSASEAPSGTLSFSVKNDGDKVTEFYLLGSDRLRIVGEVENIAPGLTRELVVKAAPGTYYTACKPGMVGKGIQSKFTVTDSGADLTPTGADKALVDEADKQYQAYVKDQATQLSAQTTTFVNLYKSGKDAEARALYAKARLHWERVEPVAESFGDLDPKMDLREADLEKGQEWTGWHRIEKDLWPPKSGYTEMSKTERNKIADQLLSDTKTFETRTKTTTFTADKIANGAKSLMDEVATGKVTGEEEIWSHTDLYDFQGNVDGARIAWENLRPLLKKKDAKLDTSIATKFAALQKLLDKHRVSGSGDDAVFKSYDKLSKAEVKELSDAVNALSEPLSKLTATVTS